MAINTLTLGFEDFDAWFLTVPVFGRVYEVLRKETFFRNDTRVMYADTIERVIQAKIKEVTAAEGIDKVEFMEARPDIRTDGEKHRRRRRRHHLQPDPASQLSRFRK